MKTNRKDPFIKKYKYISDFIRENNNFIITAHETPDGDAIGSESAMYNALKVMGKKAMIINADQMAEKYTFLDYDNNFKTMEGQISIEDIANFSLIILDTSDINNIGEIKDEIFTRIKNYIIIDHHESNKKTADNIIISSDSSSTCEVLFDLFEYLRVKINFKIAQALFVGIVYDTGSFIYPKTSAKTFSIAHKLVNEGVSPNEIYGRIYESNSISALRLQSKVTSTLKLYFNQHVAVQTMLKEAISECDALYEESDTIINIPLRSKEIKVSVFFKENMEGILRCSMRSKDNIDVSTIAQHFNGGGHKTAAGFKSKYPLDEIMELVLKMLEVYFI